MKKPLKHFLLLGCVLMLGTAAMAKLPALSDEAKAKAAEASAKAAWSGKVDAYQLCKSQDKVAAHYKKTKVATACVDPGPFVYTPAATVAAPAASPAPAAAAPAKKS